MTTRHSDQDLGQRIEELIQEHIAASRKSAQEAVVRAFASAANTAPRVPPNVRACPSKKRTSTDIAILGERFFKAVCAKPGETMIVLAAEVGSSALELHQSVKLLRRAGRVRAAGSRHMTRYFPMGSATAT